MYVVCVRVYVVVCCVYVLCMYVCCVFTNYIGLRRRSMPIVVH